MRMPSLGTGLVVGAIGVAVGMIGGQLVLGASAGTIVFLAICTGALVAAMVLFARALARPMEENRVRPTNLIVVGLLIVDVVLVMLTVAGIMVASVLTGHPELWWYVVSYASGVVMATCALIAVRRAQRE